MSAPAFQENKIKSIGKEMNRPLKYTGVRASQYEELREIRRSLTKDSYLAIIKDLNSRERRSRTMLAKAEDKRKAAEVARLKQQRRRALAPLGNELITMGGGEMKEYVAEWLKGLPLMFTIRATYQSGETKDITKDSNEPNDKWFQGGHWWKLMVESDVTIFNAEKPKRGDLAGNVMHAVANMTDPTRNGNLTAKLELIPTNTVTGNPGTQRMRDGEKHCIFDKLKTFFQYKMEGTDSEKKAKQFGYCMRKCDTLAAKYDGGITLDDLEQEIKCLQLTVVIHRIDNSVKRILNPRGDYRYNFLNNRFNHCETLLSDTATQELSLLEMNEKLNELAGSEYRYEQGKTFIKRIMTADNAYKLTMPYDNMFKEFNTKIEREFFDIDYVKEKSLFEYVQQAGNHNTHMSFRVPPKNAKLKEVDCKAGYTQFKHAPVYKGFLGCVWDFCGPVSLETVFTQIGIYTVRVKATHKRYACHFQVGKSYTLTSPLIEFLSKRASESLVARVSFEVIYGVYGSHFDMDFPKEFMDKCSMKTGALYKAGDAIPKDADAKPLYSLWVGATASVSTHRKICSNIDYRLVQEYNNDGISMDWVYDNECYEYVNGVRTLRERAQEMESPPGYGVQYLEKESSSNSPQIFAFVTDYMRQNMLYEMERINESDIYSWKVDSIVYKGDYTFRDIFRPKKVKNDFVMSPHIFKNVEPVTDMVFNEIINTHTIFTGAGGTGKSEYASKMRKMMYVAPMWSMNADFFLKYDRYSTTPQQVFGVEKGEHKCASMFEISRFRPATIYFDEATMIDEETKQKALLLNRHIRVIFGGDFDDKGRPFQTVFQSCMNLNGLTYKPFTTDYRSAAGDEIREIKQKIRAFMYEHYGDTPKLLEYVKMLLPNNIITKEEAIENYNVQDWVLASTVVNRDKWTDLLKHKGDKYYVVKHSKQDISKAFNGENCALKGHIIFEDNKRCEIRHGFTIHSAQGKTITKKIFIDLDKMDFDYCLLYTAISRAKRLDQIYLI